MARTFETFALVTSLGQDVKRPPRVGFERGGHIIYDSGVLPKITRQAAGVESTVQYLNSEIQSVVVRVGSRDRQSFRK